jgi:predicted  nucleic acid-binding Zn-ribbon protein
LLLILKVKCRLPHNCVDVGEMFRKRACDACGARSPSRRRKDAGDHSRIKSERPAAREQP